MFTIPFSIRAFNGIKYFMVNTIAFNVGKLIAFSHLIILIFNGLCSLLCPQLFLEDDIQ